MTTTNKPRFYVNGISHFYWEVVDRRSNGVVEVVEKTCDDDNREVAQRLCRKLNKGWRRVRFPKWKD